MEKIKPVFLEIVNTHLEQAIVDKLDEIVDDLNEINKKQNEYIKQTGGIVFPSNRKESSMRKIGICTGGGKPIIGRIEHDEAVEKVNEIIDWIKEHDKMHRKEDLKK